MSESGESGALATAGEGVTFFRGIFVRCEMGIVIAWVRAFYFYLVRTANVSEGWMDGWMLQTFRRPRF